MNWKKKQKILVEMKKEEKEGKPHKYTQRHRDYKI